MIRKISQASKSFFLQQQKTILSAAAIIASTRIVSALLGIVRDRLLAENFTPHDLGIYWAADRIPSFVFNLVVAGALASSFIPVFTRFLKQRGKVEAFRVASSIINIVLVVFVVLSLVVILLAHPLSALIAPKGALEGDIIVLANLTRILFVAQLFLLLSNFATSLLQSFQRFIIPALAPVVYNIGVLVGILLLSSRFGVYAPAIGTVLGGFLHFSIQFPLAKVLGIKHRWEINLRHPGVIQIGKLMLPRFLGLASNQICALVGTLLAASISFASVTFLTFAQHLQTLPISLFGVALAQASLPTLSLACVEGRTINFKRTFLKTFHQLIFFVVPASAALFVLRLPLVRLVFGSNQFDWNATVATGYVLAFLSLSIFSQAAVFLLVQAFYAWCDTKTPVLISIFSVVINILLSVFCVKILGTGVWALALVFSLTSYLNMWLLLRALNTKVGGFGAITLWQPFFRVGIASLGMALCMYLPLKFLDQNAWGKYLPFERLRLPASLDILILDTSYAINLAIITVVSTVSGGVSYLALANFLDVAEAKAFWAGLLKFLQYEKNGKK